MTRGIYPFVESPRPIEWLEGFPIYQLRQKLNRGEKMTREEGNRLYTESGRYGRTVKLGGWNIPFDDVLRSFYLEQYDSVYIVYAPDKTTIRDCTHGKIDKIQERV